ncbi:hypothetical protein BG011_008354 [Mortierella polycephala]|uniref:Uncharacterized protein n=1 Tax=Mortierella polycephala TaxID=41804 RepID=A0A9P6PQ12_9FUNG|nr:hypothetical protein BG011_008354 [Mortierella polycephala]
MSYVATIEPPQPTTRSHYQRPNSTIIPVAGMAPYVNEEVMRWNSDQYQWAQDWATRLDGLREPGTIFSVKYLLKDRFRGAPEKLGLAFFIGLIPGASILLCWPLSYFMVYRPLKQLKISRSERDHLLPSLFYYLAVDFFLGLLLFAGPFLRLCFRSNLRMAVEGCRHMAEQVDMCNHATNNLNNSDQRARRSLHEDSDDHSPFIRLSRAPAAFDEEAQVRQNKELDLEQKWIQKQRASQVFSTVLPHSFDYNFGSAHGQGSGLFKGQPEGVVLTSESTGPSTARDVFQPHEGILPRRNTGSYLIHDNYTMPLVSNSSTRSQGPPSQQHHQRHRNKRPQPHQSPQQQYYQSPLASLSRPVQVSPHFRNVNVSFQGSLVPTDLLQSQQLVSNINFGPPTTQHAQLHERHRRDQARATSLDSLIDAYFWSNDCCED